MLTIGNAFLRLTHTHTHTHVELTGKQNIFLSENSENLKKSKWFSVGSLLGTKGITPTFPFDYVNNPKYGCYKTSARGRHSSKSPEERLGDPNEKL